MAISQYLCVNTAVSIIILAILLGIEYSSRKEEYEDVAQRRSLQTRLCAGAFILPKDYFYGQQKTRTVVPARRVLIGYCPGKSGEV